VREDDGILSSSVDVFAISVERSSLESTDSAKEAQALPIIVRGNENHWTHRLCSWRGFAWSEGSECYAKERESAKGIRKVNEKNELRRANPRQGGEPCVNSYV
jgi:hypothetical protein